MTWDNAKAGAEASRLREARAPRRGRGLDGLSNEPALHDLLAEAEGLGDGYVTVARVLPNRREEQLASREVGPLHELAAAVELAASTLPAGTRVRVRLWRRGGKPVRGVVLTVLGTSIATPTVARPTVPSPVRPPQASAPAAPPPSPSIDAAPPFCPNCAELREALEGQHDLFDEVSDERDDAEALVRRLQREVADLRGDLDGAVFRAETAERDRDNARRSLTQAEERFTERDWRISSLKRENQRLRAYAADADEAAARLIAMVGT